MKRIFELVPTFYVGALPQRPALIKLQTFQN